MSRSKWMRVLLAAFLLAVPGLGFVGCEKSAHDQSGGHATQYTCPMHPDVVQDKPGKCPKCGMDLVEKQ